ncbi:hypothetical protein OROMI_026393 [Orobanche minor]
METSMINKVPMFSISEFDDWRIRMEVHLAAMHEEMIFVIQNGPIKIMKVNTAARVEGQEHDVYVEKDRNQWTVDDRKRANLDNVAMNALFVTLDKGSFSKVKSYKTAKEIWDKLKHICEGTKLSKENKISKLTQQFEFLEMKPTETLEELDLRLAFEYDIDRREKAKVSPGRTTALSAVSERRHNAGPCTSKSSKPMTKKVANSDKNLSEDEMALLMHKFKKFINKSGKNPYKPKLLPPKARSIGIKGDESQLGPCDNFYESIEFCASDVKIHYPLSKTAALRYDAVTSSLPASSVAHGSVITMNNITYEGKIAADSRIVLENVSTYDSKNRESEEIYQRIQFGCFDFKRVGDFRGEILLCKSLMGTIWFVAAGSDPFDVITNAVNSKKVKRQRVEIGAGPNTRLRATKVPDSSEKKKSVGDETSLPVEVNEPPVFSLKEKLKNLREGPGSMTAYLKLRELEKQQLQKEIPRAESEMQYLQSQSVEPPVDEAPKRKRGKTKMNHIHNTAEKKRITLNYLNQPVADNGKLLDEFSNFLGTTVRQFVSLTCASWHQVPEKELLWEYVKDKYIVPEDAKPPNEVPLSDWKILLNYWGDEKVQEIAKKNSESRNKITETHTTGSTSFAQVSHKLLLEKREKLEKEKLEKQEKLGKMPVNDDVEGGGNFEEEPVKKYDAAIYIETRKRKENREYKLPEEVLKTVNEKIVDVKKVLQTEGVEAANKLVHGGKEHSPSYLIGRLIRKKEPNSKSSTSSGTSSVQPPAPDQLVSDLTNKIRAELQQEMDQKFQLMMKMFAENNPGLKLDTIEGSEKSAEVSHGDDDFSID